MEPYQLRVVDEKKELDERTERLSEFVNSQAFASVQYAEQVRLRRQLVVMKTLSLILGERIAAF